MVKHLQTKIADAAAPATEHTAPEAQRDSISDPFAFAWGEVGAAGLLRFAELF